MPEITISGVVISTFKHFTSMEVGGFSLVQGFLQPQRKRHNLRTGS